MGTSVSTSWWTTYVHQNLGNFNTIPLFCGQRNQRMIGSKHGTRWYVQLQIPILHGQRTYVNIYIYSLEVWSMVWTNWTASFQLRMLQSKKKCGLCKLFLSMPSSTINQFCWCWLWISGLVRQTPFLEIRLNKEGSWSKEQVHKLCLDSHIMLRLSWSFSFFEMLSRYPFRSIFHLRNLRTQLKELWRRLRLQSNCGLGWRLLLHVRK